MSAWQEAAERLRQQITGRRFVLVGERRTQVETKPRFRVGQVVVWTEGRTRRACRGVVREVQNVSGWPAEYAVQLIRRDGTTGRITRKFQSELEADHV